MTACTVLYNREAEGEVGLARRESDCRLSRLGSIPVGPGHHSPAR